MLNILIGILIFISLLIFLVKRVLKKTKYGFYIVLGEFGAGKTQNTTAYIKKYEYGKEINITNYYTGYTHFQISSHQDLINILNDIYDYHLYVNCWEDREKIFKFKQDKLKEYELKAKIFKAKFPNLKKNLKFNIVLDESSILFNPRNFAKNFAGENERLLDFIYQPRKLNILFFTVVQSPMELDVKFRRLASYYRKYYKGFGFWRRYKDFYFINPEEIDLEEAEQVGGGPFAGMNLNFYPIYPFYDYNTKELIRPGDTIYKKGSIYDYILYITQNPEKPKTEEVPEWNLSQEFYYMIYIILASFCDYMTTNLAIFMLEQQEINPFYNYILSFNNPALFFIVRVIIIPLLIAGIFQKFPKYSKNIYIFIFIFLGASLFNLYPFLQI